MCETHKLIISTTSVQNIEKQEVMALVSWSPFWSATSVRSMIEWIHPHWPGFKTAQDDLRIERQPHILLKAVQVNRAVPIFDQTGEVACTVWWGYANSHRSGHLARSGRFLCHFRPFQPAWPSSFVFDIETSVQMGSKSHEMKDTWPFPTKACEYSGHTNNALKFEVTILVLSTSRPNDFGSRLHCGGFYHRFVALNPHLCIETVGQRFPTKANPAAVPKKDPKATAASGKNKT